MCRSRPVHARTPLPLSAHSTGVQPRGAFIPCPSTSLHTVLCSGSVWGANRNRGPSSATDPRGRHPTPCMLVHRGTKTRQDVCRLRRGWVLPVAVTGEGQACLRSGRRLSSALLKLCPPAQGTPRKAVPLAPHKTGQGVWWQGHPGG